ncbi:MAG: hypothetical protein ACKOX3_11075 [Bacteroidota bacterium]
MNVYSLLDVLFVPIYLLIILFSARIYQSKKIADNPEYRYFLWGLVAKIVGAVGLTLVYTLYYPGGDTLQYYWDTLSFHKLMFVDFNSFWHVLISKADPSNIFYFNDETGYPPYCRDPKAWSVVKIAFFLVTISMRSCLITNILCGVVSFFGVWQLYRVFAVELPEIKKELAISFLFVPSVFFWGSGLLKDTFTFAALGFFVSAFYNLAKLKGRILPNLLKLLLAAYTILSIKPYIFVGLVPSLILGFIYLVIGKIQAQTLRSFVFPIVLLFGFLFGYVFLLIMGDALHEYQVDSFLDKAAINQKDLKSDYHKGNSFDIGEFDPTVQGISSKFFIATFSAIYRPMIYEVNNVVMFLSSIENLLILILTIRVLWYIRIYRLFKYLRSHYLLVFSFSFAILFAFFIGLSTSNFGALVRYKIPCIPFYIASLYIIKHLHTKYLEERDAMKIQLFDGGV